MPGYIPFSAETQASSGPASGEGRTPLAVYKPHTLVTVTLLREVQMGKGADDRGIGNPGDPDRGELELQGQGSGSWLWQARENFPEEVAFKLGLEK